ncbi:hypothetical protein ASZ90_018589 [hydrocarbon metagenome]|uniref:Tetracenomycin polyketide synthesis o-methyltransferase tcmp n=1 Tax=hydrocarbon metagenome TaxID=938273 RepID=A0A0W8E5Q1_9ZZZZ
MSKISLTKEKETLFIPLFGKATESQKNNPILVDEKAIEIINHIDYDFSSLRIPDKTNTMMSLRARLIDNCVKDFLVQNNDCVALHLGCGLDSRYDRIADEQVDWYDIDFLEVIEVRQVFYQESERYHLIGSSVMESEWLARIPVNHQNYIVIAEGLLMYLRENEIKSLLKSLQERLGDFTLVIDAFSVFTSRKVSSHPSLKQTGASIHWGIDDPRDLEQWGLGIRLSDQIYFTSNDLISQLAPGFRAMYKIADKFPFIKNAHRILIYQVIKGTGFLTTFRSG